MHISPDPTPSLKKKITELTSELGQHLQDTVKTHLLVRIDVNYDRFNSLDQTYKPSAKSIVLKHVKTNSGGKMGTTKNEKILDEEKAYTAVTHETGQLTKLSSKTLPVEINGLATPITAPPTDSTARTRNARRIQCHTSTTQKKRENRENTWYGTPILASTSSS